MGEMRIAVMGAAGHMGRALLRAVHETPDCTVAGAVEAPDADALGRDAGEVAGLGPLGVVVTDDTLDLFTRVDGVLDFTAPAASVAFAELAAQARIVHVIGTTGFGTKEEARIAAAARHATVVKSGNMSLGVNLLVALTKTVAAALDSDFDIEILEMHHRRKVDAPSGTALMLGRAAAEGRGQDLERHAVRTRDGHTGPRARGDIGFAALRGGGVVGEHTVVFAGESERVALTHRAESRDIFARGAVKAALWARGRPPGLYTMADVLGL